MKKVLTQVLGLSLTISLFGTHGAFAAEPTYYPTGPQRNVAVSSISSGSWTRCYSQTMGVILSSLETLKAQCQGDYVLYAGGAVADQDNFLLIAAGAREVVFNATSITQNVLTTLGAEQLSNGTYWYAQDNLAVGFSENAQIQLNKADVRSLADENRFSLHGSDAGLDYLGGWRIGATTGLNTSTSYIKEIWVSNGYRASMPLIQTKPASATVDKNIFTCSSGSYKVGMSPVEINSVKYQLYVNDKLMSSVVFDKGNNIPESMKSSSANGVSALVSAKDALFDLSGMSSYSAYCTVDAFGFSSSASSASNTIQDAVFIAAANAKVQAWEDQRAAATAANFTDEARESRKRAAARAAGN